ncbi:MAG: hypothetical protein Q9213_001802 [Squamulea squamosa]
MEDVDSFTFVDRPSPLKEKEQSNSPLSDYEQQSSATRKATLIPFSNTLRHRYPDHTLAITTTSTCDLLGFCSAGKATLTNWNPELSVSDYQPPPNQLEGAEGNLVQEPIFAEAHITYQSRDFIVYIAECLKEESFARVETHNFILHRASPNEAPELAALYVQELILKASDWTVELRNQIWVFDQGYWSKNRQLWESAQEADWEDVILDEEMKADVRGDVEGFFREREEYKRFAIPWKRGIIFHGPPGNGKTISIRAIMKTLSAFLPRPIPTLYVKSFSYNPEYGIRSVFRKARSTAPCLLIFEDVDSLITPRTRSYFLNEVDGLENNEGVLMLGSTNHLDLLDPSISKRPSRFDRKYLFPLPSTPQRTEYCMYWRHKITAKNSDIEFPEALCEKIANITEKFSFAYMKEAFVASLLGLLVGRKGVGRNKRACESGERAKGGKRSGEGHEDHNGDLQAMPKTMEDNGFTLPSALLARYPLLAQYVATQEQRAGPIPGSEDTGVNGGHVSDPGAEKALDRGGRLEKLPLWKEIKKQVGILREELDAERR